MKEFIKRKTLGLFVKTNGLLSQKLLDHEGLILCFHRVMPQSEEGKLFNTSSLSVELSTLERTIRFFRNKGYGLISMDEVYENVQRRKRSKKFVAFTFDDGYFDNNSYLLPLMQAEEVPFIVYVATSLIDNNFVFWWYDLEEILAQHEELTIAGTTYAARTRAEKMTAFHSIRMWLIDSPDRASLHQKMNELERHRKDQTRTFNRQPMTWAQVKQIGDSRYGSIGAHSVQHLALAKQPSEAALWEMTESKKILESQIGRQVPHFAYPYGTTNECYKREYTLAKEAGYSTAVILGPGAVFNACYNYPFALPRITVGNHTTQQQLEYMHNGIYHFSRNGFNKTVAV